MTASPSPYLYVGPDAIPAGGEDFWNQPFGAARPWTDVRTVADAVAFFADGSPDRVPRPPPAPAEGSDRARRARPRVPCATGGRSRLTEP